MTRATKRAKQLSQTLSVMRGTMRRQRRAQRIARRHGWMRSALLTASVAALSINVSGGQSQAPAKALAAPAVKINRAVPKVSAPPSRPVFSPNPTAAEITRARVFPEPLVPLGTPSDDENRAIAQAINTYAASGRPFDGAPFTAFLAAHASSAWRPALLANLGGLQRAAGYHKRALATWDEAWRATKDDVSEYGRAIADIALASALDMLATRGDRKGLDAWLERTTGRAMGGPAASKARRARETRAYIAAHPDSVVASGPKALEILLDWQKSSSRSMPRDAAPLVPAVLKNYRAKPSGTPLSEVHELAGKVGLAMTMVRREAGAPIVTPSILHLGFDHFSAVLREEAGHYLVRDPALGGEIWMPREAIEEEATGYALVMSDAVANGWRAVSKNEGDTVIGHSCPPGIPDPDECPCPEGEAGMPTYSLHPTQASVLLSDTPLTYSPPRGPGISLHLRYNHREENQPQIFPFANVGSRWTLNWVGYLEEVPFTWFNQGGTLQYAQPAHVAVHVPYGGVERYAYPDGGGTYPRHYRSAAVLVQVVANPIRYERRHTDGTIEVYALSDGGVPGTRRVFLTEIIDPHGQALVFTWDAQLRLVALTDALGQVTTLQYADANALKITSVTDPFGRIARFTYDAAGRLESVTDVVNLTSRFVYGDAEFIAALVTPYGTTTFREPMLAGQYKRAIEAVDPLGAVERLEFHWDAAPVPATAPPSEVPAGFESRNVDLNMITSLHWAKGRNTANVADAVQSRWLLRSMDFAWDPGWTVGVPHTVKRPGEARTWFIYTGSTARPSQVARKLPDGSVYSAQASYNAQDNVTWRRDPVGRETTYTYAANGIDLLQLRNTSMGLNDVLATYSNYTNGHRPQGMTDASGQTTTTIYNSFGQVLTVTNAKQETTTYTYDPNGYLQTVTGPVSGATMSYTYDGYGRLRSATVVGEGVVTTEHDALNRATRTTYPDGTYEETSYNKLDVATQRDRRGRLTHFTYDAKRRLVATRDPAGRVIQQQWCDCGALEALIDANGNATRWERDAAGRVLREVRADGITATVYTYDSLGRVKTVTDPKQQVTIYTYNFDGSVASVAYTNAQTPTPGVTWTYDPAYARVTTMVDGTGTTTYTYHSIGQLGAGQVATVDGPLANDVISYTYDSVGRVQTRAIGGVPLTLTYDTLGRIEREVNALGTFDFAYDGASGRLATMTYPNGQTSAYTYYPAEHEHQLQTILHRYPNGTTLSKFDYTYDAVGNILTWRQQADTTAVIWDYGYDNANQLIRAVKRATDPQGTILQRFAYGYDPAGNRLFEQIDDTVTAWTYDRLNRLKTQRAGGLLRVAGAVNEPATVKVDGRPATLDSSGVFVGAVRLEAGTTRFTVTATDASGNTATQSYDVDQTGPSKVFTFDANGNLISDGTQTFEWNARDRLHAVSSSGRRTEFAYDGMQRRVRRVDEESGIVLTDLRFVLCPIRICEERSANGGVRRLFAGGEQNLGVARLFATDHLGSITDVTDASATVLARHGYDPWGRRQLTAGTDVTDVGFTGHIWDPQTHLFMAGQRAYDPSLARWVNEDPAGLTDGPNVFAYTRNNPISRIDPDGTVSVDIKALSFRTVKTWDELTIASGGKATMLTNGFTYGPINETCECLPTDCGYKAKVSITAEIHIVAIDNPESMTTPIKIFAEEMVHVADRLELIRKLMAYGERLEKKSYKYKFQCTLDCTLFAAYAAAGRSSLGLRDQWPFRTHGPVRRPWQK